MIVKHLRLIGPLLLLLISCATPKNRPLLEFTQLPYDSVKHSDFKRQKANFASMKQTGKFANVEIDGLPTILDAMHYQQLKQFDKSISLWKKALVESEDLLTEFVFIPQLSFPASTRMSAHLPPRVFSSDSIAVTMP